MGERYILGSENLTLAQILAKLAALTGRPAPTLQLPYAVAYAAGVITTARMLAKSVIAEGVESAEEGDVLASLGCHQLQGFSISRPMPGESVPLWVAGWLPPLSWSQLASERQSLLDGRQLIT